MKTRRKPALIEKVDHGPFHAEIRMNAETGLFSCEYGDSQSFSSQHLPEVRGRPRQRLRELGQINWQPVMEVHCDDEDTTVNNLRNCSNLQCWIERGYIGWDGHKWIWTPWVVMRPGSVLCSPHAPSELEQSDYPMSDSDLMAQRVQKSRTFYPVKEGVVTIDWPLVSNGLSRSYHIQYTEERWRTMLGILDKMRELRAGINRLLSSEQGWERLGAMSKGHLLTDQKSPSTASQPTLAELEPQEG